MNKNKYIILPLIIVGISILAATGIFAYYREQKVLKIKIGMNKTEVENLLGSGEEGSTVCSSQLCPKDPQHFWYPANPSFWFGRFEDTLLVCYDGKRVCSIERVGL